uniref:RGS domain-containing protein n=1 Tax=Meloidogyne javanica TaxID=6303 RepID=A0A915LJE0_MELJA
MIKCFQFIVKSNRWSRPFSHSINQSTTFSSVSPAYLLGVVDNSQQENCLDKLDNIKQQKDFEKEEEEQTGNQLNKVSKSPTTTLSELSSPRSSSVKIRLLDRTQQQQIGQQKSPTAVVPMPAGVGSGGGTNSPQHQQGVGLDIDLEQVLRSETARAPFHQFLQQQFCAENINFYLAVEEYRKIPEEELDRRLDFGRQIYDRHFAANCIEPVNIDNSTSNQIREAYKNNRFTATVYDVVQYQIFHLLKYDCWPRYLRAGGQLTEEFGGDSKSHDSGASQHQQPKTRSNNSSTTNRRKSLFLRLLRLQRSGAVDIDDEIEEDKNNKICHCSNPFVKQINGELQQHQQRRPLIPLNSCGTNILFSVDENKIERRISTRLPKKPVNSINNTKRARKSYGGTSTVSFWRDATKQSNNRCRACDGIIFGESKPDFPLRYCTLLCADSATSTEITLSDPFQSVRQWTVTMAEGCGLDKNACEVVDAQTGSTIDPVRQAVDALNNRVVRIMSVVKFPVVFLGPSACPSSGTSSKPSAPLPANTITPQWMLSASGQSSPGSPDIPSPPFHQHGDISFCEVPLEPESGIKLGGGLLLKHSATRSYSSNPREFFKFGRKPTVQSKVARSGGTETDSTTANATAATTTTQSSDSPHQQPSTSTSAASHLRYRKSGGSTMGAGRNSASKEADRRKSFGAAASAVSPIEGSSGVEPDEGSGHNKGPRLSGTALAVGLVAPSDIPYCGEAETTEDESTRPLYEVCSPYSVQSSMAKVHEPVPFTKSAAFTSSNSSNISQLPGANCQQNQHHQHSPLPAIFASAIGSGDKDNNNAITTTNTTGISPSHSTESGTMVWQKADYV